MTNNTDSQQLPLAPADPRRFSPWPWFATIALVALAIMELRHQGRLWWCQCGQTFLWSGDIWSSHNSQHLVDPYSFAHVEHGILFYGLLVFLCPSLPIGWRFFIATSIEVLWEVSENTEFMINRYRSATISLDYFGDSVGNSLGDILSFAVGFGLARILKFWPSLALLLITEAALVLAYRDSLFLNILMLIYPIESVKQWQMP